MTIPTVLLGLSLLALLAAVVLAVRARRGRLASGLPAGQLVYADTAQWSAVAQPYFSPRYRLTGKPDYLVDSREGLIPVEVKHTAAPARGQAYASHVMQLAAYCLLIEEAHDQTPSYGLIHYRDATLRIDYTAALRAELLRLLEEMRYDRLARDVSRSHADAPRCQRCGVRHACGDAALE